MTLLTVVWDFNPNLISIGPLEIRWYSMMWVLTFAIGMWVFSRCVRQDGYPPKDFDSVVWCGFLSTIIGARLG
ncbi:MAG: prolipoprotein diacylglyceryl transferase, partial [Alistipes sp.]|nr:prolipoprotein diacylglyceryl transferase [Alistipes sp.]